MDILLLILGLACMLIGILGSFLPVLPGISLCWLGIVLLYFTNAIPVNYWVLGTTFLVVILFSIANYILPAKGTQRFGGSKAGIWGTNIGLVIGLLAPIPLGFIIGPFTGALIGELVFDTKNIKQALRAATGSVLGILASSFIQFMLCVIYFGIFISIIWEYKALLFN
ncbi:DUF456 domain-containing protein [Flavobacterium sufflavum]|uniref:DUF456 domain-containing protein n=1 Tax=Flavobacterium sufflavum TaxID=1921138 RepID=A0A3S2U595_9FLAO|nr:DUF456 domain-containing protein [Flavobacterium sufflavum]RVT78520.1 DUF456 domain-containing protein [Flavobacterium sufflavum]